MTVSMNVAAGANETVGHRAARQTRCIASGGSSPEPTSGSTTRVGPDCLLDASDPHGEVGENLACQRSRPKDLHHYRPRTRRSLRHPPRLRPPRSLTSPEVRSLGLTITLSKIRSSWHQGRVSNGPTEAVNWKQPDQTDRLRIPQVQQLPDQNVALRRQTQLGSPRHHHTP